MGVPLVTLGHSWSLNLGQRPLGQTSSGLATSIDGVISTRRGNAGSWIPITGNEPTGEWELSLLDNLSDGREPKQAFKKEELEDILFVIAYSGRTPPWPS
jgi:hypothetical protein